MPIAGLLDPFLSAIWSATWSGLGLGLAVALALVTRRWWLERRGGPSPQTARGLRRALLAALAADDRQRAVALLSGLDPRELLALVDELAQVVRGEARAGLVALAAGLGLPGHLRRELRSLRAGVRAVAATRLALFTDPATDAALLAALADRDPLVRLAAAESLAGRPAARAHLRTAALADPAFARGAAARFWNLLAQRDAELFAECFEAAPDRRRRRLGIEAAARAGLVRFADAMVEASVSDDPELRRSATDALLALRHRAASAALERLLLDPEPALRAHAVALVAQSRLRRFAPHLLARLEDPDPLVRARAHEAALRLGLPVPEGDGAGRPATASEAAP
jgi:HEAT repeat protein